MRPISDADSNIDLPNVFCWTKYGTEAGELPEAILGRKEAERRANAGLFLWGIGNAIGPSLHQLLTETATPRVVFTPMWSTAAARDVQPQRTARWHRGTGLDGSDFEVPTAALVTSRYGTHRRAHYALVCRSEGALATDPADTGPAFPPAHVRNLRSGAPVGASQVTAVVRRIACAVRLSSSRAYRVTFAADLVAPYLVRLTEFSLVTS
jgi:hypothetical protein